MALAGVPPLVFGVVALIDLLYQFWVHTEQVGKLGWFDRWFCSPSNHRVHHAVNDAYLDKNYGGILILWDRLFGTFKDEDDHEKCVYGTRGLLNSWDPLWANAQVYARLAHDSWHARHWADKSRSGSSHRAGGLPMGGAFSQARLQHGADADLSAAHVARGAVVCAGAVCGAAHGVGAFYGRPTPHHWRTTPSGLRCCWWGNGLWAR